MSLFFREALKTLKSSGTISPSSKYLIRDCLKGLDISKKNLILEFGAGDGCFTKEILGRMRKDAKLISFEINDYFFNHCKNIFQDESNLTIHKKSALEFPEIINTIPDNTVDLIISSLPLSLFDSSEITQLFRQIKKYLRQDGCFVQYQYSIGKYWLLKKEFHEVKIDYTILNIPPALSFQCYIN